MNIIHRKLQKWKYSIVHIAPAFHGQYSHTYWVPKFQQKKSTKNNLITSYDVPAIQNNGQSRKLFDSAESVW